MVIGKHVSTANTSLAVRAKKARMEFVQSPGFTEISSSGNGKIMWYYAKNIDNHQNYPDFLNSLKTKLVDLLKSSVSKHPIKFNLKLEATYCRSGVENSSENRAFKTSAREIFIESDISEKVETAYIKLLGEEDTYTSKGSGFTLEAIDGLLLGIYKYSPMSASSYIGLPKFFENKRAIINPQNSDQQCFKWSILAKHVDTQKKNRVGQNYFIHEAKYNFDGMSFPTPLSDIPKFEKNNSSVSINIYGFEKKFQPPPKLPKYEIFPLRVVENEKPDHFDLLLVTDKDNVHFTYISNFSRLISSQKNRHDGRLLFCKRCFTSFDMQRLKFKLSGQEALNRHKLICGTHKPIFPKMPEPGTMLDFEGWSKTQRHPIVIYADFEALLEKVNEQRGKKTTVIQKHKPMSYGFLVKANEDVPVELLEQFKIPLSPIIFRGDENNEEVAKNFLESIVDVAKKIEKMLKTNIPMVMTEEDRRKHEMSVHCNLCKCVVDKERKIRDHNHLNGRFRQTLCQRCNLSLKQPKFVPCYFHNLSNYDAHFIVTELGLDSKSITVIPNSEEKYISFSKYISNDFAIRFLDTFKFMASSLSTLSKNLVTPRLEKFRETRKHFSIEDMSLVTRKGVYPYEYTDGWNKLEETNLPKKEDFFSTLTEEHINDDDYKFAIAVWNNFNCHTLGEYSDLYLKIDVLLLADVFENFRDLCLTTYNLDPAFYFTCPGFSFDAMLKLSTMKLELLHDYDMLLMIEKGNYIDIIL